MTNQVKQLELDFGILTVAQQERVNNFVKSQKTDIERLINIQTKIENLLISGGFQEGIDYVNDLKYGLETEDRKFGYGSDEFEANVTYMKSSGGCKIIFERYNKYKNEIEIGMSMVSIEHDKLECSSITSQYRAYKPSSLLQKLQENNKKAQNEYNSANREQAIINYTIEKYKTLFPNSTVTSASDYYRGGRNTYTEFKIVKVAFENGSYIIFRLGYENDKESIHKKFDAVESKLTAIELLNIFDKQNISAS